MTSSAPHPACNETEPSPSTASSQGEQYMTSYGPVYSVDSTPITYRSQRPVRRRRSRSSRPSQPVLFTIPLHQLTTLSSLSVSSFHWQSMRHGWEIIPFLGLAFTGVRQTPIISISVDRFDILIFSTIGNDWKSDSSKLTRFCM